ncbi:MAG TPA: hypothetical protein VNH14_10750 [Gemmatimonadales bacterium]|nr:hypothetical protein [Gemmatimonadales bacterium]
MSLGRRYLFGVTVVAAGALLSSLIVPSDARTSVGLATALALFVQAPLGWWLIRAVGTVRLQLIWAIGIAARLALVAACGLVVAPRLRLALAPLLFTLVGVLMCCVVVEAMVVRAAAEVR